MTRDEILKLADRVTRGHELTRDEALRRGWDESARQFYGNILAARRLAQPQAA